MERKGRGSMLELTASKMRRISPYSSVATLAILQAMHAPSVRAAGTPVLRNWSQGACFVEGRPLGPAKTRLSGSRSCAPRTPLALLSPLQATRSLVDWGWSTLRGTGANLRRRFSLPATRLHSVPSAASSWQENDDLWLEDIDGDRALEWVRKQNQHAFQTLGDPASSALYPRLKAIYESKDKIPGVVKRSDGLYYNFWQDGSNPRGLWRRTTWEEYIRPSSEIKWEVLLDVDKLGKDEGQSWVWQGTIPMDLGPGVAATRCLVQLSPGGSDAVEMREFDLLKRAFVSPDEGGFRLPEAKCDADYLDADTLLVGTSTDPSSVTSSGYPRQVRLWKRGTPLSEAPIVFEGAETDVSVSGYVTRSGEHKYEWRQRATSFYTSVQWVRKLTADGPDSRWWQVNVPADAHVSVVRDQMLLSLRSDWQLPGGRSLVAGGLYAAPLKSFLIEAPPSFEVQDVTPPPQGLTMTELFVPAERVSLQGWSMTKNFLVLTLLDNVQSRIALWRLAPDRWEQIADAGKAEPISLYVGAVDDDANDDVWVSWSSYSQPSTLSLASVDAAGEAGGLVQRAKLLKTLAPMFDAEGLRVLQREARSRDGTMIPYFLVVKGEVPSDGRCKTLLYGYGGFEVSLQPGYSGEVGAAWLEAGHCYAVANIRGGGEFGPNWHKAALKSQRQKAYEDFFAVAEDLIATGVTAPQHLACRGGSNGGLLVGNALVQRPELFGAVVCQVPLLDMQRYHTLLAGASWMAEYGDPTTEDWQYMQGFSPYHLVDAARRYPKALFTTSTRDDRVHPAHARRMVYKMLAGKDARDGLYYYENIEGGHGGAADSDQRARVAALVYDFCANALE